MEPEKPSQGQHEQVTENITSSDDNQLGSMISTADHFTGTDFINRHSSQAVTMVDTLGMSMDGGDKDELVSGNLALGAEAQLATMDNSVPSTDTVSSIVHSMEPSSETAVQLSDTQTLTAGLETASSTVPVITNTLAEGPSGVPPTCVSDKLTAMTDAVTLSPAPVTQGQDTLTLPVGRIDSMELPSATVSDSMEMEKVTSSSLCVSGEASSPSKEFRETDMTEHIGRSSSQDCPTQQTLSNSTPWISDPGDSHPESNSDNGDDGKSDGDTDNGDSDNDSDQEDEETVDDDSYDPLTEAGVSDPGFLHSLIETIQASEAGVRRSSRGRAQSAMADLSARDATGDGVPQSGNAKVDSVGPDELNPCDSSQQGSRKCHKCKQCGKAFQKLRSLLTHEMVHTREPKSNICKLCGAVFQYRSMLLSHQKKHKQEQQYKCDVCDHSFTQRGSLNRHRKKHDLEEKLECSDCHETFSDKLLLAVHRKTHSSVGPYKCYVCAATFMKGTFYVRHMRTHLSSNSSVSGASQVSGNRSNQMVRGEPDVSDCDGDGVYQCEVCPQSFSGEGQLQYHRASHIIENTLTCKVCSQVFASKKGLDDHHKREHSTQNSFACKKCDMEFESKTSLRRHRACHAKEKKHVCDMCDRTFHDKHDLARHYRKHTGERPFQCEICGATFTLQFGLRQHLRTHTGEKLYHCAVCPAQYKSKLGLEIHSRTHTGEKPYVCEVCDQAFSIKSSLTSHKRLHTGEKPYICQYCGTTFTDKSNMRRHLRTHTDEKKYQCDVCKTQFRWKVTLDQHCKSVHGIVPTPTKPFTSTTPERRGRRPKTQKPPVLMSTSGAGNKQVTPLLKQTGSVSMGTEMVGADPLSVPVSLGTSQHLVMATAVDQVLNTVIDRFNSSSHSQTAPGHTSHAAPPAPLLVTPETVSGAGLATAVTGTRDIPAVMAEGACHSEASQSLAPAVAAAYQGQTMMSLYGFQPLYTNTTAVQPRFM